MGAYFNYNKGELGVGAIGHSGLLARLLLRDMKLIRIDPITEEPLRKKNGFCQVVSNIIGYSY